MNSNSVPRRIAFFKPCCIGDVVFATALCSAVFRAYPDAQIDWWVSTGSKGVLIDQPVLSSLVDTGPGANPAATLRGIVATARRLRAGRYDLLIVPDRSPKISLAALLSGIPIRAGLDSARRGFGYTVRAVIDPDERRLEAEIYLDIARALRLDTDNCWTHLTPPANAIQKVDHLLAEMVPGDTPLIVVHPGGGVNAGMRMTSKRWPVDRLAALAEKAANHTNGVVLVLGDKPDTDLTQSVVQSVTRVTAFNLCRRLTLSELSALAAHSRTCLYIGNDTGATHIAAASGARVLAIFGPSDPLRYAPFAPPDRVAYAWHPIPLPERGVSSGAQYLFDWDRDGVTSAEAWEIARTLIEGNQ